MQLFHVVLRPGLGTQQAQAHLHQSMVQVDQHDIVSSLRHGMVEGDGTYLLGMGVAQAFQAARP